MTDTKEDYWPTDIAQATMATPVSLMRKQAALLGEKTDQQVTAGVQSYSAAPSQFVWSFQLTSPALGNYKYELFRLAHPVTLYPATLMWEEHPVRSVRNEQEFKNVLKEVLASDQTRRIVQSLLAQITT